MPTFKHGSKAKVYWNGFDVSAAFKSVSVDRSRDTAETSGIGTTDKTFIGALRDGTLKADGMFDTDVDSTDSADVAVLAAFDAEKPVILYLPAGSARGAKGDGLIGTQTAYTESSPVSDVVQVSATASSDLGAERVTVLRTPSSALLSSEPTNEPAVDGGASTDTGASGYLQILQNAGTGHVSITIQDSDDDSTWVDLIVFDDVADTIQHAAQRKTVTGTVEQYVRATAATVNDLVSVKYLAAFSRNPSL